MCRDCLSSNCCQCPFHQPCRGAPCPLDPLLHLLLIDLCSCSSDWYGLGFAVILFSFQQSAGMLRILSRRRQCFCFVFFFSFPSKHASEIYLLQLASWKWTVFRIYFCSTAPGPFLRASVIKSPPRPCELEVWVSTAVIMVLICLPSDALLQHLPSYLGFSYLRRGVSLHGCSSKAQPLLLTLDEGYLLTAALPDLERGVAPLSSPAPRSSHSLEVGLLLSAAAPALSQPGALGR